MNLVVNLFILLFILCTIYLLYIVRTPTSALFIKPDKVSKYTLKLTLTCCYMFRSTTIIREPLLEPS